EIAVLAIAEHGMAEVREVDADLVGAAGEELGFEKAEAFAAREPPEDGLGLLSLVRHRDALAFGAPALREGEPHALALVTEKHRKPEVRRGLALAALGHAHRRNADAIARGDPLLGFDPLAVDPHLAASQDAIDAALGHALEPCGEIVVDALPGLVLGDVDPAHLGWTPVSWRQRFLGLGVRPRFCGTPGSHVYYYLVDFQEIARNRQSRWDAEDAAKGI